MRTPLEQGLKLVKKESMLHNDARLFRQLDGSLLHIANMVGPDIVFAAGNLSMFKHLPTT